MFSAIHNEHIEPRKHSNHESLAEKRRLRSAQLDITFSTVRTSGFFDDELDVDDDNDELDDDDAKPVHASDDRNTSHDLRLISPKSHRLHTGTPVRPNFEAAQNRFVLWPTNPTSPPAAVTSFRAPSSPPATSNTAQPVAQPVPSPSPPPPFPPVPSSRPTSKSRALPKRPSTASEIPSSLSFTRTDQSPSITDRVWPNSPKALPNPPVTKSPLSADIFSAGPPLSGSPPRPLPGPPTPGLTTPTQSPPFSTRNDHSPLSSRSISPAPSTSTVSTPVTPKPALQLLHIPSSPTPSPQQPPNRRRTLPHQDHFSYSSLSVPSITSTPPSTLTPTPSTAYSQEVPTPDTIPSLYPPNFMSRPHHHHPRKDIFSLSNALPVNRGRLPEEESLMTLSPISPADDTVTVASLYRMKTSDSLNDDDKSSINGGHPLELDCCDDASILECGSFDKFEERRGRRERNPNTSSPRKTVEVPVFMDMGAVAGTPEPVTRPQSVASSGYKDNLSPISPLAHAVNTSLVGVLGPVGIHDLGRVPDVDEDNDTEHGMDEKDLDSASIRSLSPIRYAKRLSTGEDDFDDLSSPLKFSTRWPFEGEIEDTDEEEDDGRPYIHGRRPPIHRPRSMSLNHSLSSMSQPLPTPPATAPIHPLSMQSSLSQPLSSRVHSSSSSRHVTPSRSPTRSDYFPANSISNVQRRVASSSVGPRMQVSIGITAGKDGLTLRSPPPTVTSFGHNNPQQQQHQQARKRSLPRTSRSPPRSTRMRNTVPPNGARTPTTTMHPLPRDSPTCGSKFPLPQSSLSSSTSSGADRTKSTHSRKSLSMDSIHLLHHVPTAGTTTPTSTSSGSNTTPTRPLLPSVSSSSRLHSRPSPPRPPPHLQQTTPTSSINPTGSPSTRKITPSPSSGGTTMPTTPTPTIATPSTFSPLVSVSINSIPTSIDAAVSQSNRSSSAQRQQQQHQQQHSRNRPGGGVSSQRMPASLVTGVSSGRRPRGNVRGAVDMGGGTRGMKQVSWSKPTVFHSPPTV